MNGMTFYIVFGKSGGFRFEWTKFCKRLCLGKVAFCFAKIDVELLMDAAHKKLCPNDEI